MYTLTNVAVEADQLVLTVTTPLGSFDAVALQRLIDLIAPRADGEPVPAARRRASA